MLYFLLMGGIANVYLGFRPFAGRKLFTLWDYKIAIFMAIAEEQSTARRALREQIQRACLVILKS